MTSKLNLKKKKTHTDIETSQAGTQKPFCWAFFRCYMTTHFDLIKACTHIHLKFHKCHIIMHEIVPPTEGPTKESSQS